MKEILTIRSTKTALKPHLDSYKDLNDKWIKKDSGFAIVIQWSLEDSDFVKFVDYLRMRAGYIHSYIERIYTKEEIDNADVLTLSIDATFEPTGEELGTKYTFPCPECRIRKKLDEPLKINISKIPKKADIAKTIASDEWLVNQKVIDALVSSKFTGFTFESVKSVSRNQSNVNWYQITINSTVMVSLQTRFGNFFKPNLDVKSIMSSCGHEIKHLAYSELYLDKSTWDGSDFCVTNYYFGGQAGVVYPFQYIVISKNAYDCLVRNKIKGFSVEIAHLV